MNLLKIFTKEVIKAIPAGIVPTWLTRTAVWIEFDAKKASSEGYKAVPWVYASVKKRADAVASVPLVVEEVIKGEWVANPVHPLQQLLNNPNPSMDNGELMRLFVTHLDLSGNGLWYKVRAGQANEPMELWPLMPGYITATPGRDKLVAKYTYTLNGPKHEYIAEDVVHSAYTNPDSLIWGTSPLQAAAKAVDIDNEAANWQKISMQNRGVPDGIFSITGEHLTPEQYQQSKKMVNEQYMGSSNSRAPWVLSNAKYQQMSMTPVELDFMGTRQFTMAQVCAVYGVPIEMINGMGDANRASGENVRKTFWLDTIVPLLGEISSSLNLSLVPDFGDMRTLRIRYDISAVPALQENYTEKVTNAKGLWSMGVPFNKINKKLELGFEDIEGGDIGYIPSGVFPSSFDLDSPTEEPEIAGSKAYGNSNT